MEKCVKCGSPVVERNSQHAVIKAVPHIQCGSCGSVVCVACSNDDQCPICGFNGKN